jgi:hypothetical protein
MIIGLKPFKRYKIICDSSDRNNEVLRSVVTVKFFRIELDNEFEADIFAALLEEEGIPFAVVNHHSLAYDGLFQMSMGWGHIEIPEEYQEKAVEIFRSYKSSLTE